MKIFVTSDIHGRIDVFHKIVSFLKERKDVDSLILCGDITGDQETRIIKEYAEAQYEEYKKMKWLVEYINKNLLFVLGNNDIFHVKETDTSYLPNCNKKEYQDFVPIEYSNLLFQQPEELEKEDSIKRKLENLPIDNKSIIISHVPPYNCVDKIPNGMSFGSAALREVVKEKRPKLFFCGHVHYAYGVEKLYDTLVFNVACDETTTRGWLVDLETFNYEKIIL